MSQTTLGDYAEDTDVPDRVLEWVNRFKHARHGPVEYDTRRAYEEQMVWGLPRSRGLCPACWDEWHSHGGQPEYHIDDREEPIVDQHFVEIHTHAPDNDV